MRSSATIFFVLAALFLIGGISAIANLDPPAQGEDAIVHYGASIVGALLLPLLLWMIGLVIRTKARQRERER